MTNYKYKIALAQIKSKLSKENLQTHIKILSKISNDVDLVVFPELSLNGYLLKDKALEDCWNINNELDILKDFSKNFDIVVGASICTNREPTNSALYFSQGQLIHRHDKKYLPNRGLFEEARFFQAGNNFKSFLTKFGNTLVVVCEDLWRGSTLAEIERIEPDLLIVIANSPARNFINGNIEIADQWRSILMTSSIISAGFVIFVNRVGFEDGLGFWGGSGIFKNGREIFRMTIFDEVIEEIKLI
jgi:predicted amidohydrolase